MTVVESILPSITTDVGRCARCGGDHSLLSFSPFTNPIEESDGSVMWTHWALCPVNGEPILLATVDLV